MPNFLLMLVSSENRGVISKGGLMNFVQLQASSQHKLHFKNCRGAATTTKSYTMATFKTFLKAHIQK